jgi:hypothetical protein
MKERFIMKWEKVSKVLNILYIILMGISVIFLAWALID